MSHGVPLAHAFPTSLPHTSLPPPTTNATIIEQRNLLRDGCAPAERQPVERRCHPSVERREKERAYICACLFSRVTTTHHGVTAVLGAFGAATRDLEQGPVAISYLVHCDADVNVANERYGEIIRTYSDGENKLSFMTFGSWGGSADRQVVVLDADADTTSSMDTLVMLRITQELQVAGSSVW